MRNARRLYRQVALLAEGVDRNVQSCLLRCCCPASPSSRRAWIEIWLKDDLYNDGYVALLAEGVDRNMVIRMVPDKPRVALLAEGVDRNSLVRWRPRIS